MIMSRTAYIKHATNVLKLQFAAVEFETTLFRAIERIHARQTCEEQNSARTKEDNGVGWSAVHAEIMTSFAEQLAKWKVERKYPKPFTPKQMAIIRKIMPRYAGQLARLAVANLPKTPSQ